ncbi:MAG TPA: DUF1553 domain-containing protein [Gemmataceae bacterium]|jgi:hypothetical protein|nr:DUF1553 domain-containing protein [Gemmataceae bacterium]
MATISRWLLTVWAAVMLPVVALPARITEANRAFWAFQPVKQPRPPAVTTAGWARSPVDQFILARLEDKGLTPAPPADKRTLIRRATFDLTGLPPTPAEISAYLADHSPDAFARVVDRLLASPHYGERWGRHWLDVVRYADARDLIQLPAESDFREAWRYRDWVVEAFNRDLPYNDFLTYQIAGDLVQPHDPARINCDALVATGMLAIADFVPGDVDKDVMIADYVNDQIDVVGRACLGLTLTCARCHDHKFDPIPTADYYALAGIFFSSRLIPGPVPGNTPLVRVPLLSKADLKRLEEQAAADKKRLAELEQQIVLLPQREYRAAVKRLATEQTARYLVASWEYRHQPSGKGRPSLPEFAKSHRLQERLLARWLDYLGKKASQSDPALASWRRVLRDAGKGRADRAAVEQAARRLEHALAKYARQESQHPRGAVEQALANAALLRFSAGDPQTQTTGDGHVTCWPDRAAARDATPAARTRGPVKTTATVAGKVRPVLRFAGGEVLRAPCTVPAAGSLFAVYKAAGDSAPGQRLIGWEDSSVGRHGLGLMLESSGALHAILRKDGAAGDLIDARPAKAGFDIVCVTWGRRGTTLHRNGVAAGAGSGIDSVSADPGIPALIIGGPGSGGSSRFRGDLGELRVYNEQLDDKARARVEKELSDRWISPRAREDVPPDPLARLYEELTSPRGPFWLNEVDREKLLTPEVQARLSRMRQEIETLKKKPAPEVPRAVVVLDGGPAGTRHEGFKDARVYLRGNPKKLGKTVPRGFPRVLAGDRQERITHGSGRLQLARWITRPDNPLTARVMVNRIWQHHFGEGIVRTANNFGKLGERPTHPELLDYLADRFVESRWSVKALHRLIMLSSAYQQCTRPSAGCLARDPENRLLGRMNRRRLEGEAIRDSLLAVAGHLNSARGGLAFQDLAVPRRTLYLMSVRTGTPSDFGRLFDLPDCGQIVEKRNVSTVAPQALFLLNDPFVIAQAGALARRVIRETPAGADRARIERAYVIVLGRPPTCGEMAVAVRLMNQHDKVHAWERYCHLLLCTNEFLYVD